MSASEDECKLRYPITENNGVPLWTCPRCKRPGTVHHKTVDPVWHDECVVYLRCEACDEA